MSGNGKKAAKAKKSNFFSKGREIDRCCDMRVRIKTYCKQEGITQPTLAEQMRVSKSQMSSFMTGMSLTGSLVYSQAQKYLRTRMPLSQCSQDDIQSMTNNKWGIVPN